MPRHLPLVNQKPAPAPGSVPAPETGDERPPWHWSGIGAVLVFTLWLPLAMVGGVITQRLVAALVPEGGQGDVAAFLLLAPPELRWKVRAALVVPQLLMFVLAAMAGGALVGRFGGKAGAKEAAVSGFLAGTTAWALTAATGGLATTWMLWLPAAAVGLAAGWCGGRLGISLRARG